jgi:hypothetical protein
MELTVSTSREVYAGKGRYSELLKAEVVYINLLCLQCSLTIRYRKHNLLEQNECGKSQWLIAQNFVYQNHTVLTYTILAFSKSDIGDTSLFHAAFSSTLKLEIADSSKMVVPIYQTTSPR